LRTGWSAIHFVCVRQGRRSVGCTVSKDAADWSWATVRLLAGGAIALQVILLAYVHDATARCRRMKRGLPTCGEVLFDVHHRTGGEQLVFRAAGRPGVGVTARNDGCYDSGRTSITLSCTRAMREESSHAMQPWPVWLEGRCPCCKTRFPRPTLDST